MSRSGIRKLSTLCQAFSEHRKKDRCLVDGSILLGLRNLSRISMLLLMCLSCVAAAQDSEQSLRDRLVKRPLYLKGFCTGDKLEFDSSGQPKQPCKADALTLSGIDVLSVQVERKLLFITAQRIVLVADSNGRLQRKVAIGSRTHIFGSMMPGNRKNFDANEEVHISVEADSDGSFDAALNAIFADGLADLAASVPAYWSCYAQGYFVARTDAQSAEDVVDRCVKQSSFEHRLGTDTSEESFTQPRILASRPPPATREAVELGVSGESVIHFSISRHGVPVGFQIVHALGAGMDEATMTALYQFQFQPATVHGQPVVADLSFTMRYQMGQ
jgi:hypothetical protein